MPTRTPRSLALLISCGVFVSAWARPGLAESPPKVVAAWPAGPMEVRVAFNLPVDPEVASRVVGRSIRFGEAPKPGEVGRPGGEQGSLRVAAARLADDDRTLILVTDPHPREATYRLALPAAKGPDVAVSYTLGGVEASFAVGSEKWSGWWPSLDLEATLRATSGSAEHDRLRKLMGRPGTLTLQTLIAAPRGEATLRLEAFSPFEATFGVESAKSTVSGSDHRAALKGESTGEPIYFNATFEKFGGGVRIRAAIGPEALPASAFVLPWAPPAPAPSPGSEVPASMLSGGDPARGEAVFLGEQAKCSTCHRVGEKGGVVGPDLSDLAGLDRAWVYRNIIEPSSSIHPDYVSYTVTMKDGRVAMGVVRAEGADALKVGDIDAKQTVIPRAEVEEIRPSPSSIMPVGLLGAIGEEKTRDLLAYLTAPRPAKP